MIRGLPLWLARAIQTGADPPFLSPACWAMEWLVFPDVLFSDRIHHIPAIASRKDAAIAIRENRMVFPDRRATGKAASEGVPADTPERAETPAGAETPAEADAPEEADASG